MALFILIFLVIINFVGTLLGYEANSNGELEIKSSTITAGQNVGFYKVDDTLNLTCVFRNETIGPEVILEWVTPIKAANSQNRVIHTPGTNFVVLIIENLQENDSGDYKCRAVHNGVPFFNTEISVRINVKNKKKECTDVMFQCSAGICISKRYTCDGYSDCPHGEDESPNYCGPGNPCDNKLMCPENRCIPFTWCCESHREPNCTTKVKHSCCTHVEKLTRDVDNDVGYQYEQQRFNDMGFLQTTVYTVIGCAMAFMFIVTIIVIAICRVHVRRNLLSRCPAGGRNLTINRGGNPHENINGYPLYDLDVYMNRQGLNSSDFMSINPLLVTYNINNGVQFVGRPIDPPPYCEIITSPPKEGPPPPYASRENLSIRRGDKIEEPSQRVTGELTEVCVEPEVTESDALLGATGENMSVTSRNADDASPSEEVPNGDNPPETHKSCLNENASRESPNGTGLNSNSSHSSSDAGKSVDGTKNSGLEILVLNNRDSFREVSPSGSVIKIQNGEPSSLVSGNSSDISKGAVKKIVSTKNLDAATATNSCSSSISSSSSSSSSGKRKNRSFSKSDKTILKPFAQREG